MHDTQHPQVADLIAKLSDTPNEGLGHLLAQIETWTWPRSDLNAWIKVLNKFDQILEDCIREYDIDKIQTRSFDESTKNLLSGILKFERLLLENSTNRKMFASYDVSVTLDSRMNLICMHVKSASKA
jgi:E3 ubiquitin-protein ligase HUWE1